MGLEAVLDRTGDVVVSGGSSKGFSGWTGQVPGPEGGEEQQKLGCSLLEVGSCWVTRGHCSLSLPLPTVWVTGILPVTSVCLCSASCPFGRRKP